MKRFLIFIIMFLPFLGFVNVNADANNPNLNTSLFENYSMAKVQSELELLNYESEYCDVTFDCNGGKYNSNNMFIVTVIQGELMNEPDKNNLNKLNSTFIGWYTLDGEKWNFEKDAVLEDLVLKAHWKWDDSVMIETIGSIDYYFTQKYSNSSGWNLVYSKSLDYLPIEVGGKKDDALFPEADIKAAIQKSGVPSSYGGCGPIAMMGIMDYFSRYKNYTSIIRNPKKSEDRIQLAYDILKTTSTYEIPSTNNASILVNKDNLMSSSEKDKNTLTLPKDYVSAFNKLMNEKYHLDKQIKAYNHGLVHFKSSKISRIKESIDAGLPVTVYAGNAGKGYFGNHYVNIYEYEIWNGIDSNGKGISKTIFNARLNWGREQSYNCHMDSDMLDATFSGVIYYTVTNNNQLIRPNDFSKDFVNKNDQGQYYFYDKKADIITKDGFAFSTNRLRCGYIENSFLVLSANRKGAGVAFLEMNYNVMIKAINFDISLWGSNEGLIANSDSIKLYYKTKDSKYIECMNFDISKISKLKKYPDNYYVEFPEDACGIKIEVVKNNPTTDYNRGRVIIGNINLFY